MEEYLLFALIAGATISSPGPGVLLTLTNSIRFGVSGSMGGILGIAIGTFLVAGVSATSLGVLLETSTLAFSIMKFIGAAYLIYLGVKLWRSPPIKIDTDKKVKRSFTLQFLEGVTIQVTNPKAVFFFMSIFPQFVDYSEGVAGTIGTFSTLVITYSSLVLVIHVLYAFLAKSSRAWLSSRNGGKFVNRAGGSTFVFFGIGLISTSK